MSCSVVFSTPSTRCSDSSLLYTLVVKPNVLRGATQWKSVDSVGAMHCTPEYYARAYRSLGKKCLLTFGRTRWKGCDRRTRIWNQYDDTLRIRKMLEGKQGVSWRESTNISGSALNLWHYTRRESVVVSDLCDKHFSNIFLLSSVGFETRTIGRWRE